jgi:hypothetical protein
MSDIKQFKLAGLSGNVQLGKSGPRLKINGTAVEVRTSDDTSLAVLRGAQGSGSNDLVNLTQLNNGLANAVNLSASAAYANATFSTITYTDTKASAAYVNAALSLAASITYVDTKASAVYSNATFATYTYANTKADATYANATFASGSYANATFAPLSLVNTKADATYTNAALANAATITYADTKASAAYANATFSTITYADTKASAAYANATFATQSIVNTKADAAYTNAALVNAATITYADTKASAAYANATFASATFANATFATMSFTNASILAAAYTAGPGLSLTGRAFSANTTGVSTGLVANNIAVRSTATNGQILRSIGTAGSEATWGALDLTNANSVTGALPVTNGGTGATTAAASRAALVTPSFYRASFTSANVSNGSYVIAHNLGQQFVAITLVDNTNSVVMPDNIVMTNATASTMDLTSFGALSGTWQVIVLG